MSPPRISDRIKQDHRDIESLYQKITQSSDTHELIRLQNLFTWELARHLAGEELVLYPAFEKYMRDGNDSADKDRREHRVVCLRRYFHPGAWPNIDIPDKRQAQTVPRIARLGRTLSPVHHIVDGRSEETYPRRGGNRSGQTGTGYYGH